MPDKKQATLISNYMTSSISLEKLALGEPLRSSLAVMDVSDCTDTYPDVFKSIFQDKSWLPVAPAGKLKNRYSSTAFKDATDKAIEKRGLAAPDHPLLIDGMRCKV